MSFKIRHCLYFAPYFADVYKRQNMYYSLLKTLNSKLESIQERVPIEKDFEELTLAFNNEINGEILKLQNNVVRIQSYPVGKTNVSTPLADQKSEEKAQNKDVYKRQEVTSKPNFFIPRYKTAHEVTPSTS